jgi:hypothetical protein
MTDQILEIFSWWTPVLEDDSIADLPLEPTERAILEQFRQGWGKMDTASMLRNLTAEYGETAGRTIEKVLG